MKCYYLYIYINITCNASQSALRSPVFPRGTLCTRQTIITGSGSHGVCGDSTSRAVGGAGVGIEYRRGGGIGAERAWRAKEGSCTGGIGPGRTSGTCQGGGGKELTSRTDCSRKGDERNVDLAVSRSNALRVGESGVDNM